MSFYAITFIIMLILFVISVTRYFYKTHELKTAKLRGVVKDNKRRYDQDKIQYTQRKQDESNGYG